LGHEVAVSLKIVRLRRPDHPGNGAVGLQGLNFLRQIDLPDLQADAVWRALGQQGAGEGKG
jgi:hypothetical protein